MDADEPDLLIAGYARLFGSNVDPEVLAVLHRIGPSADNQWGAIFGYERNEDGSRTKWTFFTADHHYAELLATSGDPIELSVELLRERFPAFQRGWIIDDDGLIPGDAMAEGE